ncbi:MAG: alcohol dehydrogenase catalytic domain-containing protein [Candidatus Dormibacteria bacterium]
MRAAVYFGRRDVRAVDWDDPGPPPPGWVQVAVSWCGICGTDLEELTAGPLLVPRSPHPLTQRALPLVLGHEGTGVVVASGEGSGIDAGTRVGIENSVPCGGCVWCRRGNPALCDTMAVIGLMLDGALAERVNVPATTCLPLSRTLPDELGALAEPLAVAVRAVRRGGVRDGDDVHVVGGGTVGLLAAQVARARGARSVTLRERSSFRRGVAAACGIDAVPADAETERADVVIECSGTSGGAEAAIGATRKGGTTVIVGVHAQPVPLSLYDLVVDERSVVASLSHTLDDDYRPAVELLESGRIQAEPLITDRVELDDVVTHGFAPLLDDPDAHLKVLVRCAN